MVDDINALQRLELKEAFDEFDKVSCSFDILKYINDKLEIYHMKYC